MDVFSSVLYGFQVALQPLNLIYCFFGVLIRTLVGVLPGLGPAAAIALLLPTTFKSTPVSGVIMLAGIYYGAMYGGSTTSILVNIPGESASVVTCLDGYQMARKGRAGPALGIAAFGSFIAGTFSVIALTFVGPLLAGIALRFGPPEFFALMIVGIMVLTFLSSGSMLKALMMAAVGLTLGGAGMDAISGKYRFTFNVQALLDGVGLVPAVMGLFGIAEVIENLETEIKQEILTTKIKNLFPNLKDWADSIGAIIRGSDPRLLPRDHSRRRGHHLLFRLLCHREEDVQASGGIWPRRHCGRRRPGGGQQRCRGRLLYPASDPRHPGQRHHGHLPWGPDDPWLAARTASHDPGSGRLLGHHREHVHRQRHASRSEPPAHPALGDGPEGPLLSSLPAHPPLLHDRGLHHREQHRAMSS